MRKIAESPALNLAHKTGWNRLEKAEYKKKLNVCVPKMDIILI